MKWLVLASLLLASLPAFGQVLPGAPFPPRADRPPAPRYSPPPPPERYGPRRLGGPRTGVTLLSAGAVDKINEAFQTYCYDYDAACDDSPRVDPSLPVVTQFGWQFERRLFQAHTGLTGVTEWVLLLGGAERGLFLPSATFLAGLRAPGGFEVGVGPNLSLSGPAYALAVGMNNEIGEVNIPVNAAVVFGQDGPRLSLLVGFTVSESRY